MTVETKIRIVGMVTDQGTAADETAVCENCATPARMLERFEARHKDVNQRAGFKDVSNNTAIQCQYCGVYGMDGD